MGRRLRQGRREKRIGFFGGTFNPPHLGHLLIAEQAREQASLDLVMFVPAFQPPHKTGSQVIASHHRLNMVRLAIKGNKRFAVSDIEIKQGGISYTVTSLRLVKEQRPDAELFLIMGSDSLRDFDSWKAPREIGEMVELLVYPRQGFETSEKARMDVQILKAPRIEISSTEIRMRVLRGETIRYLVPVQVEEYIHRHRLYAGND